MARKCTGRPSGRPPKNPTITPEQVIRMMAMDDCPKLEVAAALGMSVDTFDRREGFAALYRTCRLAGKSEGRKRLREMAMTNPQVMVHYSKTILRNRETSGLELSGPDGDPIEVNSSKDPLARLDALIARHSAAIAAESDPRVETVTH
jgi:hypothetical protein